MNMNAQRYFITELITIKTKMQIPTDRGVVKYIIILHDIMI